MQIKVRTIALTCVLTLITALVPNITQAADLPFYATPQNVPTLTSLINSITVTNQDRYERSEPSDPYRFQGSVINDPFKKDGSVVSFLSVTPFQNFSMVPSKLLGTSKSGDIANAGMYFANLPPCFSATQSDCIYEFSVSMNDGTQVSGKPFAPLPSVEVFPSVLNAYNAESDIETYSTFPSDNSINAPAGGNLWLWSMDVNGLRKLFAPSVVLSGKRSAEPSRVFTNPNVRIQILPTSIEKPSMNCTKTGCGWTDIAAGIDGTIFNNSDFSIKRTSFPIHGNFTLKFRTTVPWTSWMVSSITGVVVSGEKSGSNYFYSVSGENSRIPAIQKHIPVTEANKAELVAMVQGDPCSYQPTYCAPMIRVGKDYVDDYSLSVVARSEKLTDGIATFSTDSWAMASASFMYSGKTLTTSDVLNNCLPKGNPYLPAGITGSNATLFEHNPPQWNSQDNSFTYKVAAYAKDETGKPFIGNYTLMVNSEVAKCLWGSSASTASAKIEIVNSDGSNQIATVSIASNKSWFIFQAAGFHFSSPKLVVSLKKVSDAKSSPASTVLTKTILCQKGKVIKKISGSSPKCPSGYKVKI